VRIGIIGLTEPEAVQASKAGAESKVLDPMDTALKYVGELRDKVDLLIVLSHLGLEEDKLLARLVPGINVIIGGKSQKLMKEPELVGKTLIAHQGYRGEWMGRFQATFDSEGRPSRFKEDIISLTDQYADDEEIAALVSKYNAMYPSPTPAPTRTHDPRTPTVDRTKLFQAYQTRVAAATLTPQATQ